MGGSTQSRALASIIENDTRNSAHGFALDAFARIRPPRRVFLVYCGRYEPCTQYTPPPCPQNTRTQRGPQAAATLAGAPATTGRPSFLGDGAGCTGRALLEAGEPAVRGVRRY